MMDGASYPSFFDHIPNRLNGCIVVVTCEVEENTKGGNLSASINNSESPLCQVKDV